MQNNDPQSPGEAQDRVRRTSRHDGRARHPAGTRSPSWKQATPSCARPCLREHAELENQRRRLHRDLEQARRFANEKLLNELLPVYDGLESGLASRAAMWPPCVKASA